MKSGTYGVVDRGLNVGKALVSATGVNSWGPFVAKGAKVKAGDSAGLSKAGKPTAPSSLGTGVSSGKGVVEYIWLVLLGVTDETPKELAMSGTGVSSASPVLVWPLGRISSPCLSSNFGISSTISLFGLY